MTLCALKTRKRRFQTNLKPSISSSVNFGYVAANRSAGHATNFVNIGRKNVVLVSKSGWVETEPIILVATALLNMQRSFAVSSK